MWFELMDVNRTEAGQLVLVYVGRVNAVQRKSRVYRKWHFRGTVTAGPVALLGFSRKFRRFAA